MPKLLSTTTAVSLTATGLTNLYTVPAGKTAYITSVVVIPTTATAVTAAPTTSVGYNGTGDDVNFDTSLTGLDATTEVQRFLPMEVVKIGAAADILKINVKTVATATTLTATVQVYGYLR